MEEEASDLSTASRVLHSLGETFREKLIEKPVPTTKTPLVLFFARGFMTYQAVIRLWKGGFWQDAAVLSRSLREASYQARWLRNAETRPPVSSCRTTSATGVR